MNLQRLLEESAQRETEYGYLMMKSEELKTQFDCQVKKLELQNAKLEEELVAMRGKLENQAEKLKAYVKLEEELVAMQEKLESQAEKLKLNAKLEEELAAMREKVVMQAEKLKTNAKLEKELVAIREGLKIQAEKLKMESQGDIEPISLLVEKDKVQ